MAIGKIPLFCRFGVIFVNSVKINDNGKIEMCLLLILLDMTNTNEGGGELLIDVVSEDGSDSRTFLRPECVRVS